MDIDLGILFLILSNIKINFYNQKLSWRLYIIAEVFFITRQVELIRKKEFAAAIVNPRDKIFVVYITSFSLDVNVYPW